MARINDDDNDQDLDLDLEDDEDLEDVDLDTDDEDDDDSGDDSSGAPTDKRVKDLQSAKDKETARANKLQKQLDALVKGKAPGTDKTQTAKGSQLPPEVQVWLDSAKTQVRTQLFESDPRLKEYGLDVNLIGGSTPEEMRASYGKLVKTVNKIEEKARAKVLKDHGLASPELSTSDRAAKGKDWSAMSSEDFLKYVDSIR